jgi:hypothetical protein
MALVVGSVTRLGNCRNARFDLPGSDEGDCRGRQRQSTDECHPLDAEFRNQNPSIQDGKKERQWHESLVRHPIGMLGHKIEHAPENQSGNNPRKPKTVKKVEAGG